MQNIDAYLVSNFPCHFITKHWRIYYLIVKKIHCKTLMTIFFQFLHFLHVFFNCSLSFYSIIKHLHIHYLIVKKIYSKNLMTIFFQILVILFFYKTFTQSLFNCQQNKIQNIDDYCISIFPCQFYSITKYLHIHIDFVYLNHIYSSSMYPIIVKLSAI